jgi:hypothetical protein
MPAVYSWKKQTREPVITAPAARRVSLLKLLPEISACCIYFINKFSNEHRPTDAWLMAEIKRRVVAHGLRAGHVLDVAIIELLLEQAQELLTERQVVGSAFARTELIEDAAGSLCGAAALSGASFCQLAGDGHFKNL